MGRIMSYIQITLLVHQDDSVERQEQFDPDFLVDVLTKYVKELGMDGTVEVTHPTEEELLAEIPAPEFDEDDLRT